MAGRTKRTAPRRPSKGLAAGVLLVLGATAAVLPSAASAASAGSGQPRLTAPGPVARTVFGTSWPVYHHDGLGSGADPTGTNLSPAVAACHRHLSHLPESSEIQKSLASGPLR